MAHLSDTEVITGYQTQENRGVELLIPIFCSHKASWLGCGYYFWEKEEFAQDWGLDGKKGDDFNIYSARLDISKCIDTEYSRDGRALFEKAITEVKAQLNKQSKRYSIDVVHKLLAEKFWKKLSITGIIYGDTPSREKYKIGPVVYLKRVQIVMFSLDTISEFKLHSSN